MADSLNDTVQDAIILAQIQALRAGATLSASLREQIAALEKALLALLATSDPASPVRLRTRQARVETFLKDAQPLIREAYSTMSRTSARQITAGVLNGIEALTETINTAAGVPLLTPAVSAETISILVTTTPFPSVPSPTLASTTAPEWWKRQMAKLGQRVEDALQNGVRAEETLSQLVTRLRGTPRHAFTDGVMALAKRDVEALASTAMSMGSSQGQVALWDGNPGVIKGLKSVGTLDHRTGLICIARSGKMWTVPGHEPMGGHGIPYLGGPPWHMWCRSVMTPVFHTFEDLIGAKGRRFDQQLDALPEGTRSTMDGQIPASTTFHEWLTRQPEKIQLRLLGKTRQTLWKSGKITLSQLIEQVSGRVLRIDELV